MLVVGTVLILVDLGKIKFSCCGATSFLFCSYTRARRVANDNFCLLVSYAGAANVPNLCVSDP